MWYVSHTPHSRSHRSSRSHFSSQNSWGQWNYNEWWLTWENGLNSVPSSDTLLQTNRVLQKYQHRGDFIVDDKPSNRKSCYGCQVSKDMILMILLYKLDAGSVGRWWRVVDLNIRFCIMFLLSVFLCPNAVTQIVFDTTDNSNIYMWASESFTRTQCDEPEPDLCLLHRIKQSRGRRQISYRVYIE